jgi:hypothetical protein
MAKRPRNKNISLIIFDSFTNKQLVALHSKYNPVECLKGKYRKWVMLQKKGEVRNLWKRYGMLQGEPMLKLIIS